MPQDPAGAPVCFISVMGLVSAGQYIIRMYLDDVIGLEDCPINPVATLATFFARVCLLKLNISPHKSRIGATCVDFLGHLISEDGLRPNDNRVAALSRTL